mmetsp:Transcript_11107/g.20084  ORF Transcript_11107/g.20084 Transcript_11107/m.20084 type:complete len:104 (-) Transcript_11107:266-577(-)
MFHMLWQRDSVNNTLPNSKVLLQLCSPEKFSVSICAMYELLGGVYCGLGMEMVSHQDSGLIELLLAKGGRCLCGIGSKTFSFSINSEHDICAELNSDGIQRFV